MASVAGMNCDVLVVGGGTVGLTAALELRCRAVEAVVIDDRRQSPAPHAKAVGIQPRTVGLGARPGSPAPPLMPLRGALVYGSGRQVWHEWRIGDSRGGPYRFLALPQYETERVLAEARSRRMERACGAAWNSSTSARTRTR